MAKHRRRRSGGGRPRKPGARTPSGRLSRAYQAEARDSGTKESERHRLALCNGSDPALSASVSGNLFANHLITVGQHQAAIRFAMARHRVFGTPLRTTTDAPLPSEDQILRSERAYEKLCARLSVDQHLAVVDLALGYRPPWLKRAMLKIALTAADEVERCALLSGLEALARD